MFDILVFGAGTAGCSIAGLLAKKGFSVLLLNKNQPNKLIVGENLDASAKEWFSYLEIDEEKLNCDHLPAYNLTSLWDSEMPVSKESIYNIHGNGWHLDRDKFDCYLLSIANKNGVVYDCFDDIETKESGQVWNVSYQSSGKFYNRKCKFIVDCTGRNHYMARKLEIKINRYDALISINCFIEQKDLDNSTFVEAAENGWWYSTPAPNKKRLISYYTSAKTTHFKDASEKHRFFALANSTELIGGIGRPEINGDSTLFVRYANSEMCESIFGLNWMCVGDSAAAFDPLSSQGINTALKMAVYAGIAIQEYFNNTGLGLSGFEGRYKQTFSRYISERPIQYARVKKWPESSFWSRQSRKSHLVDADTNYKNLIFKK